MVGLTGTALATAPWIIVICPWCTVTVTSGAAAAASGTAAAVTSAGAGASALSALAGVLSGPIGWTVLGATESQLDGSYTFDCWKAVLHDNSSEPSNGKILKEVIIDPRIKTVTTTINNNETDLPYLLLENIWDEKFRIDYLYLPFDQLAAHAVKI